MRYLLIHHALPAEMQRSLSAYGTCIPLPPFEKLPFPVSAHPDMLVAKIGGTLIIHEEYAEGRRLLESLDIAHEISHTPVEKSYPHDVVLNCFAAGGCLFANEKAVSEDVLRMAETQGLRPVSVKQGYAKCASAIAGGAIATADKSIANAAAREGIPTLLLAPHPIGIDVYDTGFIGGASFALDDKLFFFGKIEDHPQYGELRDFFGMHGVTLVSLGGSPLFDYGGAIDFYKNI